ncbi:MAG: Uma2 family endonuclease [Planctomycetota bacterium]|nr:Uma2 family endonuclease [Planctomycetota bacterium]
MTAIETRPPATVEDYLALPDDVRAELLGGEIVLNPSPDSDHQAIAGTIYWYMRSHVRSTGGGRVRIAPFDIHLPTGQVVQPDVVFIGKAQLSIDLGPHVKGVPDLLIEVLSPGGAVRDRIVKRDAYAQSGVPEYWLVDGTTRTVDVYRLEARGYANPLVHKVGHVITSRVLPDLQLPVAAVFEELG